MAGVHFRNQIFKLRSVLELQILINNGFIRISNSEMNDHQVKCNISQIWHVGWSPILVVSLVNQLPHITPLSTSTCFESLKAANEHEVPSQNYWCPKILWLKVSIFPKTHAFHFPRKHLSKTSPAFSTRRDATSKPRHLEMMLRLVSVSQPHRRSMTLTGTQPCPFTSSRGSTAQSGNAVETGKENIAKT